MRDYLAPDAVDSVNREIARFLQFTRTAPIMGEYLAHFDLLRRKGEPKMQIGGASTDVFASALCIKNASPRRSEKLLALHSEQANLGISFVSRQMLGLFGPRGGAAR